MESEKEEKEKGEMATADSETTFWVAITHEAIVAIGEDYPDIAAFLANSAAIIYPLPLKSDVRARYKRDVHKQ